MMEAYRWRSSPRAGLTKGTWCTCTNTPESGVRVANRCTNGVHQRGVSPCGTIKGWRSTSTW